MNAPRPRVVPISKPVPDIEFDGADYPRLDPGQYPAYCRWAGKYFDPQYRRFVCMLVWTIFNQSLDEVIGKNVGQWFRLGNGEKPRASLRSKYLAAWIEAAGRLPNRKDRRLSPQVFMHRMAVVEIGDAASVVPHSVVKRVVRWETGAADQPADQDHSRKRKNGGAAKNGPQPVQ